MIVKTTFKKEATIGDNKQHTEACALCLNEYEEGAKGLRCIGTNRIICIPCLLDISKA